MTKVCIPHNGIAPGICQELIAESRDDPEVLPVQVAHALHELPRLPDRGLVQHVRHSTQPPQLLKLTGEVHEEGTTFELVPAN